MYSWRIMTASSALGENHLGIVIVALAANNDQRDNGMASASMAVACQRRNSK